MTRPARPFIIPVFLPHSGCPCRCVFCNQSAITGQTDAFPSPDTLRQHVDSFLNYKGPNRHPVQLSFYGGNFLGQETGRILPLLETAGEWVRQGKVDSLRFSTRPDTVVPDTLRLIRDYPITTIELGVQSMDGRVLALSRRGHTPQATVEAVHRLKADGYEVGLQMMVGLPGDSPEATHRTGRILAELAPDFVRIYPTVVLAGSPLAGWYASGRFQPISMEEAIDRVKRLYLLFTRHTIPVIRMGLQASSDLEPGASVLAGPYHPAFGHRVYARMFRDMATLALEREQAKGQAVTLRVNPRCISRMQGLKKQNIQWLSRRFNQPDITVSPDPKIAENTVATTGRQIQLSDLASG